MANEYLGELTEETAPGTSYFVLGGLADGSRSTRTLFQLANLADVDITGQEDGSILYWDEEDGKYKASPLEYDGADFSITGNLISTEANNPRINFFGGAVDLKASSSILRVQTTYVRIFNGTSTLVHVERFDGNVGIGTSDPDHKLHVVGDIAAYGLDTDDSNYERVRIANDGAGMVTIAAESAGTGTDDVDIELIPAGSGGRLQYGVALNTAVDGGSTATFLANAVGSTGGPTTAAQNGWLLLKDSAGADIWIPVWK